MANRLLTQRLVGRTEWEEFPGISECRKILGGSGNVQEIEFPTKGFSGAALRLFDPARDQWWIYWGTSRAGLLEPPVVGRFAGGRGDFYGDDTHDGTPIRVHFLWSQITPTSAHWEQRFSSDGGRTWEANWIMDFSRTGS